jgi:hypothetical protein
MKQLHAFLMVAFALALQAAISHTWGWQMDAMFGAAMFGLIDWVNRWRPKNQSPV